MTRRQLRRSMSSRELMEWAVYDKHEPIGERRGDFRIAMLCDLVAKVAGNRHSRIEHFLPNEPVRQPTPTEQAHLVFGSIAKRMSGSDGDTA